MQIVLYLVLLKNSLGWGKLNLRSNILKRLLRIPADYFYNRCYGAPVQACSLAPSKLLTRSTGLVLTPRNSSSMRFPVTAIIKSARFFIIFFYLFCSICPSKLFKGAKTFVFPSYFWKVNIMEVAAKRRHFFSFYK